MDNLMDLIFGIVYNDHDSDLIGRDQVDDYTIDTCLTADQGYHDNPRCKSDLWSPVPCPCAQENRAFSPFIEHQQDLEDAVNLLIEARVKGENCSIQFETEVSDEDIAWVMAEVERRLANARIY